jgi:hypothetical protein
MAQMAAEDAQTDVVRSAIHPQSAVRRQQLDLVLLGADEAARY